MYEISHGGVLFAVGGDVPEIREGWHFPGPEGTSLRWGTLMTTPGAEVKVREPAATLLEGGERIKWEGNGEQEFLLVLRGGLEVTFRDKKGMVFMVKRIEAGDFICLYWGAHLLKAMKGENLVMIAVKTRRLDSSVGSAGSVKEALSCRERA